MANSGVVSGLMISLILLALFTMAITTYVSTLPISGDEKTGALLDTFQHEQNVLQETTNSIKSGLEKMSSPSPGEFFFGGVQLASAIKNLITTVPISITDTLTALALYFGLPTWVVGSVLAITTLVLVFGILNWIKGGGSL